MPSKPPHAFILSPTNKKESFNMQTVDPNTAVKHDGPASPKPGSNAATASAFGFDVSLSTAIAANGARPTETPVAKGPLAPQLLDKMYGCWRAANYLCIGQI